MKYFFTIFIIIFIISCGSENSENCSGTAPIPNDGPEKLSFWEEYFDVVYEDLKLQIEGVYQTEEEVYYNGEMQIIEIAIKINDRREISYNIGDCGDSLAIPILIAFDGRLHMGIAYENGKLSSFREIAVNPGSNIHDGSISLSEYNYYNLIGYREFIPFVKISDEILEDIDWGYDYCNSVNICKYLEGE